MSNARSANKMNNGRARRIGRVMAIMAAVLLLILFATACGSQESGNSEPGGVIGANPGTDAGTDTGADGGESGTASEDGIDIDLTKMSATMAYAQVADFLYVGEEYEGKVIRMRGEFVSVVNQENGNTYYGCIVRDAAACCGSGIEFSFAEGYERPGGMPEQGEEVTVVGIFNIYEEGGYKYVELKDAVFE